MLGIITIFPTVIIGKKYFDGRVEENSYEKGIAYDKMRDLLDEKGLKLNLNKIEQNGSNVKLMFDLNGDFAPETMKTEIEKLVGGKPLVIQPDKTEDFYVVSASKLDKGYHILKISFNLDGEEVRLKKSFYIN